MAANKDLLLSAKRPEETVEVAGVGEVRVRGMSAKDQEWFAAHNERLRDDGLLQAYLILKCVIDDEGNYLFDEDDLPQIAEMPVKVVDAIVGAANRLSGFTEEDELGN